MTDYLLKYMSFLTTSEMAYVHQTRKKVIFVREQDLDLEMFWQFIWINSMNKGVKEWISGYDIVTFFWAFLTCIIKK